MKNYAILYFGEHKTIGKTIFCKTLGIYIDKVKALGVIKSFYNKNFNIIENSYGYIGIFSLNDEEIVISISPPSQELKTLAGITTQKLKLNDFISKYEEIMNNHLNPMKSLYNSYL